MKIEEAIEHQKQLVLKWESRVEELTRVITKYPWNKMEYDFGDWRESEIKGRTQQIAESNLIIDALEKQIPKEPKPNKRIPGIGKCQICKTELCIDDEDLHYCPTCGQRLK